MALPPDADVTVAARGAGGSTPLGGRAGATPRAATPVVWETAIAAAPHGSAVFSGPDGGGSGMVGHSLADPELLHKLVRTLQADNGGLDTRLTAMRNDRDRLEKHNARLRASNLEKDRQIALLLASTAATAQGFPATGDCRVGRPGDGTSNLPTPSHAEVHGGLTGEMSNVPTPSRSLSRRSLTP